LEDNLNRLLTREYLEVLRAVVIGSGATLSALNDDTMECAMEGIMSSTKSGGSTEVISDLGKQMLNVDIICQSIFIFLLK
jgi:hypothetical protein